MAFRACFFPALLSALLSALTAALTAVPMLAPTNAPDAPPAFDTYSEMTFMIEESPAPVTAPTTASYGDLLPAALIAALAEASVEECPRRHEAEMCTHIKRDSGGKARKEVPDEDCCSSEGACSSGFKLVDAKAGPSETACFEYLAEVRTCCVRSRGFAGLILLVVLFVFVCPCVCLALVVAHRAHASQLRKHTSAGRARVTPADPVAAAHAAPTATFAVVRPNTFAAPRAPSIQRATLAPRDARRPGVVQAQHADPESDPTTIVQGYLAGHEPPGFEPHGHL